jgi:hypothetical protein
VIRAGGVVGGGFKAGRRLRELVVFFGYLLDKLAFLAFFSLILRPQIVSSYHNHGLGVSADGGDVNTKK